MVDTQNAQLTGSLKVNNHYFEAGNVQFNLSKVVGPLALAGSDGESITKAIDAFETNYQNKLELTHDNFRDGLFKKVRRALPVTGQKFNWDQPKSTML